MTISTWSKPPLTATINATVLEFRGNRTEVYYISYSQISDCEDTTPHFEKLGDAEAVLKSAGFQQIG